ncbi:phospholipase D family protein [Dinoroseobacter sp. PD6]|uniref:phospholipase D family protein n=1 Tax=Dinoroseobacter sp. PD6 TaxID=3028384 RepID=UPI00237C4D24|nr:phospholipase D family protein [Dinoroseobacter sp. PD6]MDD9718765.1 phospholipase D family protein [Dinoroseobacter sp. PD6]
MLPERTPFQVLITAEEAWPAFERAVLDARDEIQMGFRIFDMTTALRSDEGRAVGADWFDLLAHKLGQGVRIRLVVSDFDPVMAAPLHKIALATARQGAGLAEVTGAGDRLEVVRALHPARAGLMWRSVLGPLAKREKGKVPVFATVTHHQKIAVIDREWLYIGGLDQNERRFDTLEHDRRARRTWTDVQLLLRGPEAAEAAAHLDGFLAACAGQGALAKGRYLRRTISAPRRLQAPYLAPWTRLREIEAAHLEAIRDAEQLIYIETQFLRSSRIAAALAHAGMSRPGLRLILVLPALPDDVAFEDNRGADARFGLWLSHKSLKRVTEAFGPRAAVLSPVKPERAAEDDLKVHAGAPMVYVHSKVLICDDRRALVCSANLNGRSLRWDTEVALDLRAPERVGALWRALAMHWWGGAVPDSALALGTAQAWWAAQAEENARSAPEARRGFMVPHDIAQVPELYMPMPGVPEDIV